MDDFLQLYPETPPAIPSTYTEAASSKTKTNLTRLWDENIKKWLTRPIIPPGTTTTTTTTTTTNPYETPSPPSLV